MTPQERASSLSRSGLPALSGSKTKREDKRREYERISSLDESDDDDDEEDETSFGIIPKSRILADARQSMTEF